MVFPSKLGDLKKKEKKKGLHRNSKGFSRRNQKFKDFFRPNTGDFKKKDLHRNSKVFSGQNQIFKGFFWPKSGNLLKKKGLHRLCVSSRTKKLHYFGPNNGKFLTTSAPKSLWGGCFQFWSKNRPQKH